MSTLNIIPARIKYYLTEWKSENPEYYTRMYGNLRLNELSKEQLYDLLSHVSQHDLLVVSGELNCTEVSQ